MAYNSDGYIMIDFTEVDFRRTNQTIEGLFKRCVDVIGTNKFILVINANGRTPLPATCSFTNNQYVIDTCIYMFAISSNDNLFIRRNDVPASDIIDDSSISVDKTWSSNKIDSELDGKQDTLTAVSPVYINADNEISVDLSGKQDTLTAVSPISINADNEISVDLSGKQDTLTAVSPISISEDDEISVDLSSKQDTLTAGDNISIVDNVISSVGGVRTFNYKGNGSSTFDVTLPFKWHAILAIQGMGSSDNYVVTQHQIINNLTPYIRILYYNAIASSSAFVGLNYVITETTDYKLKFTASNSGLAFNELDHDYTIIYI